MLEIAGKKIHELFLIGKGQKLMGIQKQYQTLDLVDMQDRLYYKASSLVVPVRW